MADVIFALNIVIFLTAAFFLGVESAMYSIPTAFAASMMLEFILHGLEESTAITIISEKCEAIRKAITDGLRRGLTIYKGRGGVSGAKQEFLMCVVTWLEPGAGVLSESAEVWGAGIGGPRGGGPRLGRRFP